MLNQLLECEEALEKIKEYDLNEAEINNLLGLIMEHPTFTAKQLIEITDKLSKKEKILLNSGLFSINPILNENKNYGYNLLDFAIPAITKYIPPAVLSHLTESHARVIADKILDIDFDKTTSPEQLHKRIDEMFLSGGLSIPVQGLRQQAASVDLVVRGSFAPMLYKGIQFGKEHYEKPIKSTDLNKSTLRNALKDYKFLNGKESTPMTELLPKFMIVLKKLIKNGKNNA